MKKLLAIGILSTTAAFCGNNSYYEDGPQQPSLTYESRTQCMDDFWICYNRGQYSNARYFLSKFRPNSFHDKMYKNLCGFYISTKIEDYAEMRNYQWDMDEEITDFLGSDD